MRKLWHTSKVKMGEENIKSMKSRTQKGDYSKCVHMHTMGRGFEKLVIRYVRTKWMIQTDFVENFCALVRSSTLEHHQQQGKCRCFFHHNYDYFILCDTYNLHNFTYLLVGL